MKKLNLKIVSFILLFCIVFFNACVKNYNYTYNCEDEKRYPFTEDELKWVKFTDTAPTFKITSRYNGFHIDTVKVSYDFSYDEGYETTEWCGNVLRISYFVYIRFPLHDGRTMSRDLEFTNTKKGGGMKVHFGSDEYLYYDTKLDTALINGKIYHDVFKSRSGNYYAKGIGWIYYKNNENETAEILPKD